jgi:hypothetical protein
MSQVCNAFLGSSHTYQSRRFFLHLPDPSSPLYVFPPFPVFPGPDVEWITTVTLLKYLKAFPTVDECESATLSLVLAESYVKSRVGAASDTPGCRPRAHFDKHPTTVLSCFNPGSLVV